MLTYPGDETALIRQEMDLEMLRIDEDDEATMAVFEVETARQPFVVIGRGLTVGRLVERLQAQADAFGEEYTVRTDGDPIDVRPAPPKATRLRASKAGGRVRIRRSSPRIRPAWVR